MRSIVRRTRRELESFCGAGEGLGHRDTDAEDLAR